MNLTKMIHFLREIGFDGSDKDLSVIAKLPTDLILSQARELPRFFLDESYTRGMLDTIKHMADSPEHLDQSQEVSMEDLRRGVRDLYCHVRDLSFQVASIAGILDQAISPDVAEKANYKHSCFSDIAMHCGNLAWKIGDELGIEPSIFQEKPLGIPKKSLKI